MNIRVLFLPKYGFQGASSRHRVYQYIQPLEMLGFKLTVSPLFSDAYLNQLFTSGKRSKAKIVSAFIKRLLVLLSVSQSRYDIVIIHTEAFPYFPALFEKLLTWKGVPYVLDYDDALFHQYDQHCSPIVRKILGQKIATAIQLSHMVTAGNAYLAEYAHKYGAKQVKIIPTVIDLERYPFSVKKMNNSDTFTIGWIGSPSTAKYLQLIAPALEKVCRSSKVKLILIGSGEVNLLGVDLEVLPWSEDTEVELMHTFDVGIMPLPDEPWARGKCGFKLIQYMACGLPVVASPVGVNVDIVEEGVNGFLATTQDEWVRALITLKDDPALRSRFGHVGRERVEKEYSLQVTVPKLVGMLEELIV